MFEKEWYYQPAHIISKTFLLGKPSVFEPMQWNLQLFAQFVNRFSIRWVRSLFVRRTPAIVCRISHFNQTMPTLVLDLESSLMLSREKSSRVPTYNFYKRRYFVCLKWMFFITFFQTIAVVLVNSSRFIKRTDQFIS